MSSRKQRMQTRKRVSEVDPTDADYIIKRAAAKRGKKSFVEPELVDLTS